MTDISQLKETARDLWSRGDYACIAERLEPAAQALVEACAISAGQEVLDVAAGNENLAVAVAHAGAAVVASDLTPAMVELGRMRTETAGLGVEWVVADAEELPFDDGRFDCAASTFGAMFAPRPEAVARELFRLVRPGGSVGMAKWTPEGFIGRWFQLAGRYGSPPPPDLPQALDWGREEVVRERFEGLAGSVGFERGSVRWSFEDADAMLEFYAGTAGPGLAVVQSLEYATRARLRDQFAELVGEFTEAFDGSVEIDGEYLLVIARRRG